jgi:non-ribosomal peptide synthetase component F
VQRFEGATHEVVLGSATSDAIVAVAREEGVTPYVLLLAVFSTLLYRVTGQDDVLLGSPFANRSRPEFEPLIGYFANTLVVRARLAANPSFRDLLARVRATTLELLDHQELAFESIVEAVRPPRDAGVNPLFQVNFRVRVDTSPTLHLSGMTTHRLPVEIGLARFDLALELHVHEEGVLAEFNYDTSLFERGTIERLADAFVDLLGQVLDRRDTRLLEFRVPTELGLGTTARRAGPVRRSRAQQG